jgi:hypothetical protein
VCGSIMTRSAASVNITRLSGDKPFNAHTLRTEVRIPDARDTMAGPGASADGAGQGWRGKVPQPALHREETQCVLPTCLDLISKHLEFFTK